MTPTGGLIISIGDPAGVGPEITLRAMQDLTAEQRQDIVLLGARSILDRAQDVVGSNFTLVENTAPTKDSELRYTPVEVPNLDAPFGQVSKSCGEASYRMIVKAVEMTTNSTSPSAIVTAPINKEALNAAGHHYDGHTGLLAHLTDARESWMLLTSEQLSVLHVSTHVSLRDAIDRATEERVFKTIFMADKHLRRIGISRPRIAVAGLNPHCGEHGLFGTEDDERLAPAVKRAQEAGITVYGPLPPDAVYRMAADGKYDLVVAQYHDQGHIPMKMIAFDTTVNVSLGLSIDRTSVDHGTAFDIAGTGRADHRNMLCAIAYARKLITRRDAA
ncbi:MAG: 4-hydroxythreonine-4-phosphate dehydrogenase PdxA [Pseudomonadota bacterium]